MSGIKDRTGPDPVDIAVGRRVAERRISLGYNQSDLGRALGLTFQQVQKYEKGTNRISSSKLWATAQFLKVDIGYFFEGLTRPDGSPADSTDVPIGAPPTRHSMDISRSAPTLPIHHQKLVLDLIRAMKS